MKRLSLLLALLAFAFPGSVRADLIKQSSAYSRTVLMTDSADHVSGKTGLTLTITASKAGAAFGAITPTVTELANGWYKLALTTGHTDTLGALNLHIAATGADPTDTADQIVAFDPTDSAALGLTAVPISLSQPLPTTPTANTVGHGLWYGSQKIGRMGTAQAGTTTTITLDAGASSVDNIYASHFVKIYSGIGSGQFATIVSYNGTTKVATITRPGTGQWTTTPDATSLFWIEPEPYATVQSNLDKSAYALSQTFPTNFNLLSIDGSGRTTLTPTEHNLFAGDIFNATAASYNTPLTMGQKLNAAGSASDPFANLASNYTTLGTMGKLFVDNLNAPIGSRMATFNLPNNFASLSVNASDGGMIVHDYAAGKDPATLVLAGSVGSGVTVSQALAASMRNLKSNVGTLNTSAHTRVVTYFVPGTSDAAASANTGTPLFTATVHYASDNVTILYTTYN